VNEAEIEPKLLNLWKKAQLAREQRNWEYVVNLALPVVKAYPTYMEARMLVRLAEGEIAKTAKKGLFGGGGGMSFSSRAPTKIRSKPSGNSKRTSSKKIRSTSKANLQFYELGLKAGLPDLAVLGLETIRAGHPENTKIAHQLAEHYMAHELPEKAAEVYRLIVKQDPRDMVAIEGEKMPPRAPPSCAKAGREATSAAP